jgi:hypothetical protein
MRVPHGTSGDGIAFERDEEKCLARYTGPMRGQQSELLRFALEDPIALRCAFFVRLAAACARSGHGAS